MSRLFPFCTNKWKFQSGQFEIRFYESIFCYHHGVRLTLISVKTSFCLYFEFGHVVVAVWKDETSPVVLIETENDWDSVNHVPFEILLIT